jgi:hypothetical protein
MIEKRVDFLFILAGEIENGNSSKFTKFHNVMNTFKTNEIQQHALFNAFCTIGNALSDYTSHREITDNSGFYEALDKAADLSCSSNPWFTKDVINSALSGISVMLEKDKLRGWLQNYKGIPVSNPVRVFVIMAGNIPLVGFHDFLCVLMSGNSIAARLSSSDSHLLPKIADFLICHCPEVAEKISFPEGFPDDAKAVIATGSNNTGRYFKSYFGHLPHLFRGHRNAVALLHGNETDEELVRLGDDVFSYFGLGCRNVSLLLIPEGFDPTALLEKWKKFGELRIHNKYMNNYTYRKAIYLMNGDSYHDGEFLLLRKDENIASPLAVLHYKTYVSVQQALDFLSAHQNEIQCVITGDQTVINALPFGTAQFPGPADYADNVDTLHFLIHAAG